MMARRTLAAAVQGGAVPSVRNLIMCVCVCGGLRELCREIWPAIEWPEEARQPLLCGVGAATEVVQLAAVATETKFSGLVVGSVVRWSAAGAVQARTRATALKSVSAARVQDLYRRVCRCVCGVEFPAKSARRKKAEIGPNLVDIGPTFAELVQLRSRRWAESGRVWPKSAKSSCHRFEVGRTSADF